jgi:hypothetical protein
MLLVKRFCVLMVAALAVVSQAAGQSKSSGDEMSVEESYLQEAIELMIIRETSHSDGLEQKLIALEYIGNAIDRGRTGEEIRATLEYLSLEGTLNKARENGRLVNDYPQVRRQAAKYLGEIATPEAKNALLKICSSEKEPMVLQEAIKSLGTIGLNDNDETVHAIAFYVKRFTATNPDNLLALSAVDAVGKIAEKNGGIKDPDILKFLIDISTNGLYIRPVQERAKQVMLDLRKYAAQEKK